jgi:hypothetical protein
MITLALMVDAASTPDGYIATWRGGEIYIEQAEASPFSGPQPDLRT